MFLLMVVLLDVIPGSLIVIMLKEGGFKLDLQQILKITLVLGLILLCLLQQEKVWTDTGLFFSQKEKNMFPVDVLGGLVLLIAATYVNFKLCFLFTEQDRIDYRVMV